MTSESTQRIPPIKLKLSLSSKPGFSTPTPASAPLPASSKKGKGRVMDKSDNHVTHTSSIVLRPPTSATNVTAAPSGDLPGVDLTERPIKSVKPPVIPSADGQRKDHSSSEAGPSTARLPILQSIDPQPRPPLIPSTPQISEPVPPTPDRLPATPIPSPTKRSSKSSGKSSRKKTGKLQTRPRPTAIPPRLLSADPSTPRSKLPPPLPSSAKVTPEPVSVKIELIELGSEDEVQSDPIFLPLSSSAAQVLTPKEEDMAVDTPTGQGGLEGTPNGDDVVIDTPPTGKGKGGGRWMRLKRPIKELAGRIMIELRRKDEYALFEQPANLDDLPDYAEIVGGEDKMMDLGTMQSKVDKRGYRAMDQVEHDLRTLVTAAQKFNPRGTIPHTSATRLLTHGLKHIERSRPLVRTPSPSPDWRSERGTSTVSGREMTGGMEEAPMKRPMQDIPPLSYIPEEMLLFPPNSNAALAVGYNLNGGKRVYAKRQIRGREKFVGKWRHWDLDGTRDLAEMDEPEGIFGHARTNYRIGTRVIDWKGLRKDAWWDWDGLGGPDGRPPLPTITFPRPPTLKTRELGTFDWGVHPEITAEMVFMANRTGVNDDQEVLSEHLRPLRPRQTVGSIVPHPYSEPLGRSAWDWVRDVCTGDVKGDAYLASVEKFVAGAMEGTQKRNRAEGIKVDLESLPLDEYVEKNWQNGALISRPGTVVQKTLKSLHDLNAPTSTEIDRSHLLTLARSAYPRLALRYLHRPSNTLDIAPLLRKPDDFGFEGVGGKQGVKDGLDWAAGEINRLNIEIVQPRPGKRARSPELTAVAVKPAKKAKRDPDVESAGSSPLTAPPDSPPQAVQTTEAALRRLRLELVALSKYYPLAGLRKMDAKVAERLLPENARKLMTKKGP